MQRTIAIKISPIELTNHSSSNADSLTSKTDFVTLIGEEIAGDWNIWALADIAQAFGGDYLPYTAASPDSPEVANPEPNNPEPNSFVVCNSEASADETCLDAFEWLMAAENRPDAKNIYDCRVPLHSNIRCGLLVGNEAKGLRRRTLRRANIVAEIPLVSKNINCLKVAAAAAIMLYYLTVNTQLKTPLGQKKRTLSAVQKSRPDVLLLGGREPMELGSVIRSACAFGWERVFLADRYNAWYACDRLMKSEGRGAARRGRNPIKVIPTPCSQPQDLAASLAEQYDKIVVVTCQQMGLPLYRQAQIARTGEKVLVVLPDERESDTDEMAGETLLTELQANTLQNDKIVYAHLPPMAGTQYHYRQAASIALAEVSRQLGQPEGDGIYLFGKKQRYQKKVAEEINSLCLNSEDLSIF